jgi:hypothetical protein
LIEFVFKRLQPEEADVILLKNKLNDNDPYLLILSYLQEQLAITQNLFQFLAINRLTEKPFALEKLEEILVKDDSLVEAKNFSLECQEYIAESTIKAIKIFIKEKIMLHVPKENTRDTIHYRFNQFFTDDYSDRHTKPLETLKIIIEKLPLEHQVTFAQTLKILQHVLEQCYQLLDAPAIVSAKNQRWAKWDRARKEEEYTYEARRELKRRLALGQQSHVSHQRMEELFGKEAIAVQEQWQANLGTHFFDANDKKASESLFSRKILAILSPKLVRITRLKVGPDSSCVRHALAHSRLRAVASTMTLRRDAFPASPVNARLSWALRLALLLQCSPVSSIAR